jgi:hypothetical protein
MSSVFYGKRPWNFTHDWRLWLQVSAPSHGTSGHGHWNWTKTSPELHGLSSWFPYSRSVMRAAFIVRLGRDTKPAQNHFEGWVEEVDSGNELRFHSTTELLGFLGQRFQAVFGSEHKELDEPRPHTSSGREPTTQTNQALGSTFEGQEE